MTEPRDTRPADRPTDRTVDPTTGRPADMPPDPISPTGSPAVGRGARGRSTWLWAALLVLVVLVVLWAMFGFGGGTVNEPGTAVTEPDTTGEAVTPPAEPSPTEPAPAPAQ